jgi:hypothetical protein
VGSLGTSGAVRPAVTGTADLRRLGKRSAYRLGQLRQQGVRAEGPPPPLRPQFTRNYRRGPVTWWVLGLVAAIAAIAAGTLVSLWFLPFLAGVAAALVNQVGGWRLRVALPTLAIMALVGWGLPLAWHVLRAARHAPAARTVAYLGGVPASAYADYAVLLLAAVAEAFAGYWLGRALVRHLTW